MTNGAVLLLVERILDSQYPSPEATLTDIHMLVMTGGRERTTEEFQELLAASGFELVRVILTGSSVHVVEGVAVSPVETRCRSVCRPLCWSARSRCAGMSASIARVDPC
jgi:hypothetical protein